MYNHWFISRQKRSLIQILPALISFNDICVGKVWSGNTALQLAFEDELARRNITQHGRLRARKAGQGGGGIRTLFKEMKDLGLVYTEDETKLCRLTSVAGSMIRGSIKFVDAMRLQLKKYQYPSAVSFSGSGAVSHAFKVHPFQFLFRLLLDDRLDHYVTVDEVRYIVIHEAETDSNACFERVVSHVLQYRNSLVVPSGRDDSKKTYWNIANTFFNYITLTQYVDRPEKMLTPKSSKETAIRDFVQSWNRFIPNPELPENYIRAYGRGNTAKDLKDFDYSKQTVKEKNEASIDTKFVLLSLETPITQVDSEIVREISARTGFDEKTVESCLLKNHPDGNLDEFFVNYRDLAQSGTARAVDFEKATCEMFRRIFGMKAIHVGPIGNTPDVIVFSDGCQYCGIIDDKAYKNGFSITGNFRRVMEDEYIPNYQKYGKTNLHLAFFTYISGSFSKNIDSQIAQIVKDTGVHGSAMPVDILIAFAQDYAKKKFGHDMIRKIFSVDREVKLSDIGR